jgi:hypothetical protein
MKYIKSIFEGAKLLFDFDGMPKSAELNIKNSHDKLEYLKTYEGKPAVIKATISEGSFNIHYGLELDEKLKPMVRSKQGGIHRAMFKVLSDALKDTDISGGMQTLVNFIKNKIKNIYYGKGIDYIIPMGSTKSLSGNLASAIKQIMPTANIDPVDKMTFRNIVDALNWKYILDYDRKVRIENKVPIISNVKRDILKEIDVDNSGYAIIQAIKVTKTGAELKNLLLKTNKNHPSYYDGYKITWETPNFIIRSSGISYGGSRSWYKNKYHVPSIGNRINNPALYNIVRDVVLNNRTMLIVDDNVNSKVDMRSVFTSIENIAYNILEDQKTALDFNKNTYSEQEMRRELKIAEWTKRVSAYVLINLDGNKMGTSQDVKDFKKDLRDIDY